MKKIIIIIVLLSNHYFSYTNDTNQNHFSYYIIFSPYITSEVYGINISENKKNLNLKLSSNISYDINRSFSIFTGVGFMRNKFSFNNTYLQNKSRVSLQYTVYQPTLNIPIDMQWNFLSKERYSLHFKTGLNNLFNLQNKVFIQGNNISQIYHPSSYEGSFYNYSINVEFGSNFKLFNKIFILVSISCDYIFNKYYLFELQDDLINIKKNRFFLNLGLIL